MDASGGGERGDNGLRTMTGTTGIERAVICGRVRDGAEAEPEVDETGEREGSVSGVRTGSSASSGGVNKPIEPIDSIHGTGRP